MAELADAADLKSAGLKQLVGVRVPLSAPTLAGSFDSADAALRISAAGSRFAHACKSPQLKIRRA